jgi:hypothetical protein
VSEKHEKWTANTLNGWLHEVILALRERPPEGFCCASHSLITGGAIAADNVGASLHKIKYLGGLAIESSVMLDYIDPTVLAWRLEWLFFGWLTTWVANR